MNANDFSSIRNPGINNIDFSLPKEVGVGEARRLQFRADFFNLSNHPQFGEPVGYPLSANFGRITRTSKSNRTEVWGPVEQSAAEEKACARYRRLLSDAAISGANAQNGRAVFQQTCGACHKMYGEGSTIGPDITGSNRANLDYLLFNVLDPNGEVQDACRMVVVTTRDGRTYSGNVVAETDRQLTLRTVGQDAAVINKAVIQSRDVTAVSMMPPGLFDTLTESEVLDLVAYLPWLLTRLDRPSIYNVLRDRPESGAVCELPLGIRDGFGTRGLLDDRVLFYQTMHARPLAGGFAARLSPSVSASYESDALFAGLLRSSGGSGATEEASLPDRRRAGELLATHGIRFVMLNHDTAPAALVDYAVHVLPLTVLAREGERTLYLVGE